jgi:hypothetical protein
MAESAEDEPRGEEGQTLQTETVKLVKGFGQEDGHDKARPFHSPIAAPSGPIEEHIHLCSPGSVWREVLGNSSTGNPLGM